MSGPGPAPPPARRSSRRWLAATATAAAVIAALTATSLSVAGWADSRMRPAAAAGHQAGAQARGQARGHAGGTLTAADARLLDAAQQVLIGTCMARHDFRYWPAPSPAGPPFPYLVDSVAWARRHGFGGGAAGPPGASWAELRYLSHLPTARRQDYGVVLNGIGPGAPGVTAVLPQGGVVGQNLSSCRTDAQAALR